MNKLLATFLLGSVLVVSALSQVTISNFSADPTGDQYFLTNNTWQVGSTLNWSSGVLTLSGAADSSGSFSYAELHNLVSGATFDATALTNMSILMETTSGNAALGFTVNLIDSNGATAATATFNTASLTVGNWSTLTAVVSPTLTGDLTSVTYWGIDGPGGNGTAVHMSFQNISVSPTAVPEPSTYAGLLGFAALGLVYFRRRKQAA